MNANQHYDPAEDANSARRERDYWRKVAVYLASCHGANAEYDGQLKGVSKSRRERFASICDIAARALAGQFDKQQSYDALTAARERCESAAVMLRAKVGN